MTPSGVSQVDIADVCGSGGLVHLVQALPAGAPLSLLLLLLLPALSQAAHQHTLNLLLALFQDVLQRTREGGQAVTHMFMLLC